MARTVVITGASAGVGRAIAHRFARAGWRIGLIARDAEALEEVRQEVAELGGFAMVAAADVADAEAVFAAADRIENDFGSIDVWINDAMVTVFAQVWQMTPEEFRRVTEVTYLGQVHGTMAALGSWAAYVIGAGRRSSTTLTEGFFIEVSQPAAFRSEVSGPGTLQPGKGPHAPQASSSQIHSRRTRARCDRFRSNLNVLFDLVERSSDRCACFADGKLSQGGAVAPPREGTVGK